VRLQFRDRVDTGLLVLRLGTGLMFALVHGWPKLAGGVTNWKAVGGAFTRLIGISVMPEFWGFLAMLSEFGGGLCLIAGVLFRPACALIFFTMSVAAVSIIRGGYGFGSASQPVELAIVVAALFLIGPGKFTLRQLVSKTKTVPSDAK
jgi:putative oxidoreductase